MYCLSVNISSRLANNVSGLITGTAVSHLEIGWQGYERKYPDGSQAETVEVQRSVPKVSNAHAYFQTRIGTASINQ